MVRLKPYLGEIYKGDSKLVRKSAILKVVPMVALGMIITREDLTRQGSNPMEHLEFWEDCCMTDEDTKAIKIIKIMNQYVLVYLYKKNPTSKGTTIYKHGKKIWG